MYVEVKFMCGFLIYIFILEIKRKYLFFFVIYGFLNMIIFYFYLLGGNLNECEFLCNLYC